MRGGEGDVSHKNVRRIVKLERHSEPVLITETEHYNRTFFWFWPLMWHIVIPQANGQKLKKNVTKPRTRFLTLYSSES